MREKKQFEGTSGCEVESTYTVENATAVTAGNTLGLLLHVVNHKPSTGGLDTVSGQSTNTSEQKQRVQSQKHTHTKNKMGQSLSITTTTNNKTTTLQLPTQQQWLFTRLLYVCVRVCMGVECRVYVCGVGRWGEGRTPWCCSTWCCTTAAVCTSRAGPFSVGFCARSERQLSTKKYASSSPSKPNLQVPQSTKITKPQTALFRLSAQPVTLPPPSHPPIHHSPTPALRLRRLDT